RRREPSKSSSRRSRAHSTRATGSSEPRARSRSSLHGPALRAVPLRSPRENSSVRCSHWWMARGRKGRAMANGTRMSRCSLSPAEKQRIEIEYWRDSPTERPGADSIDNLLNKMAEARLFRAYLERLRHLLCANGTVVELGAGQGWSSCLYK